MMTDQRMSWQVADILEQNGHYCLYLERGWYHTNFPVRSVKDEPVTLESGHTVYMPAGGELQLKEAK
jgi:hypothetical protein